MTDKIIAYLKKAEIELKLQHEANVKRHHQVHMMSTCDRLAHLDFHVPEISEEDFHGLKKTKCSTKTSKDKQPQSTSVPIQNKFTTVVETKSSNHSLGQNSEAQEKYIVNQREDPTHRNLMNWHNNELPNVSQCSDSFDRSLEKCNSLEMLSKISNDEDLNAKKITNNK